MCKITFICQKRKGYAEGNIRARIKWGDNLLLHSIGINWSAKKWHRGNPSGSNANGMSATEVLLAMKQFADKVNALLSAPLTAEQLKTMLKGGGDTPATSLSQLIKMYLLAHPSAENTQLSWRKLGTNWAKYANSAELSTRSISEYLSTRCAMLNASSYNQELTLMRSLIKWATSAKMISGVEVLASGQKATRNHVLHITAEELRAIESAELPDSLLVERSRFILQCLTGLRASDICRITADCISGDTLTMRLRKTAEVVTIPLTAQAIKHLDVIIGKKAPDTATRTRQIKHICRLAGIDALITRAKRIGGNVVEVTQPKWYYIGTHTARRSFICNLIAVGVSSDVIMSMTGHRSYASMRPYIGVTTDTKRKAIELLEN